MFTDSRMHECIWEGDPISKISLSQLLFSTNAEAIQYLNLLLKRYPTGIISPLLWGRSKIYHEPPGGLL